VYYIGGDGSRYTWKQWLAFGAAKVGNRLKQERMFEAAVNTMTMSKLHKVPLVPCHHFVSRHDLILFGWGANAILREHASTYYCCHSESLRLTCRNNAWMHVHSRFSTTAAGSAFLPFFCGVWFCLFCKIVWENLLSFLSRIPAGVLCVGGVGDGCERYVTSARGRPPQQQ
jgi:hypothetical protein